LAKNIKSAIHRAASLYPPATAAFSGREPLIHLFGRRFGPAPLQPLQGEDPKLDVAPRDIVRREPKALYVGIDGTVKITRLRRLAGSLEVRLGLRLYWSIRFRHKSLSGYLFK
jgi:hypothetical protein